MIKKNKAKTAYINHLLNDSPSKAASPFAKGPRFQQKKTFSPDKFYELPDSRNKRATTFGYGQKTNFMLNNLSDPAKYHLRSEFDQIAQGYRFGIRPADNAEVIRQRFVRDKSAKDLGRLRTTSTLYEGKQQQREDGPRQNYNRSPEIWGKKDRQQQREEISDFREGREVRNGREVSNRREAANGRDESNRRELANGRDESNHREVANGREASNRQEVSNGREASNRREVSKGREIREGISGERKGGQNRIGDKSRGKSTLQNSDQNKQRKSAYRLKYEFSNNYLLDDKRSSYIQFLDEKNARSPIRSPIKHSQSTFGFEARWKHDRTINNVGPGNYNRFSVFGHEGTC